MNYPDIDRVKAYLQNLQETICQKITELDGKQTFLEQTWERTEGGGGRSRVLTKGALFEQAGVNFSHIKGEKLPASASAHRPELAGRSYQAMGVSLVIHPLNPYIPTTHANVRFFIAEKEGCEPVWWFGGGFDLTPFMAFMKMSSTGTLLLVIYAALMVLMFILNIKIGVMNTFS